MFDAMSIAQPPILSCDKARRIASLDGIRAVAVGMVLISHAINHQGVELPLIQGTWAESVVRSMGRSGVVIFFVLSGYLITSLLVREYDRSGAVSLARFWFRRAFRIFPVFYAYLIIVGLFTAAGVFDIHRNAFAVAATYTWNYQFLLIDWRSTGADSSSVLGHLWTLAVEEQFYLIFPLVFAALRPKLAFGLCFLLIVITPAIRLGQYAAFPGSRNFGSTMGHTMFGVSIAIGCLWALAEYLRIGESVRLWLTGLAVTCMAGVFYFVADPVLDGWMGGKWALPIGESLSGLAAMILIASAVRHAQSHWLGRFLNLPFMIWFGVISYSIYIWQQLPFSLEIPGVPLLAGRAVLALCAIAIACVSYYLLELPCLRLRDRIDSAWSRHNSNSVEMRSPVVETVTETTV